VSGIAAAAQELATTTRISARDAVRAIVRVRPDVESAYRREFDSGLRDRAAADDVVSLAERTAAAQEAGAAMRANAAINRRAEQIAKEKHMLFSDAVRLAMEEMPDAVATYHRGRNQGRQG
jgi:hypothetical protein